MPLAEVSSNSLPTINVPDQVQVDGCEDGEGGERHVAAVAWDIPAVQFNRHIGFGVGFRNKFRDNFRDKFNTTGK